MGKKASRKDSDSIYKYTWTTVVATDWTCRFSRLDAKFSAVHRRRRRLRPVCLSVAIFMDARTIAVNIARPARTGLEIGLRHSGSAMLARCQHHRRRRLAAAAVGTNAPKEIVLFLRGGQLFASLAQLLLQKVYS